MNIKTIAFGIALGSNLGDRLANLKRAVDEVLKLGADVRLMAAAPVYETDPVDCPEGSQSFYNTVIEVEATFEPLKMLEKLREIESKLGRPNDHRHHEPRTVDLDVLYADDVLINHPNLILPHPRMTQRRFVLEPLADIRPRLILPGQTSDVQSLLNTLKTDEEPLRKVSDNWCTAH